VNPERPFWQRGLLPAVAILAALNLLALLVWTGPRGLRQRSATARLEAARIEAKREREATAWLRERVGAIRSNTADVEHFYTRFVGTERNDLVPTLEAVETMARSPGLRPGPRGYGRSEVKDAPLERIAITLPLSGSYDQLVGFLGEVERSPRFLTIDRVALHAERGSARLQVEISTYLRATPGELAVLRSARGR
jgi:Tfp pilus assembly protein PilO